MTGLSAFTDIAAGDALHTSSAARYGIFPAGVTATVRGEHIEKMSAISTAVEQFFIGPILSILQTDVNRNLVNGTFYEKGKT
jgi:hypothetical protein